MRTAANRLLCPQFTFMLVAPAFSFHILDECVLARCFLVELQSSVDKKGFLKLECVYVGGSQDETLKKLETANVNIGVGGDGFWLLVTAHYNNQFLLLFWYATQNVASQKEASGETTRSQAEVMPVIRRGFRPPSGISAARVNCRQRSVQGFTVTQWLEKDNPNLPLGLIVDREGYYDNPVAREE
ncbi:hypothetical protein B0H19DRAFT_1068479 [Mycena capillaripes]|nr:hypothetical protein B0H19DRAFT_1068479 [Mycena capillaripes]